MVVMKITVLVSQSRRDSISRLKDFLDRRFITSSFYVIGFDWTLNGEERLLAILRDSYDFLIVCQQDDLKARWIPYITGYSHERTQDDFRRINSVFFIDPVKGALPYWLRHTAVVKSYIQLNEYFLKIKTLWHSYNDRYIARRFLKDMGYERLNTPVLLGDKQKDLLLLELYIEGGGNPNYIDEEGVPLLCKILRKDEKKLAYHLIERGANVTLVAADRGTNALMEAASRGHGDLAAHLIKLGSPIDLPSKEGQTALILAMGNQYKDTARVLIEAGADGTLIDNLGMSALKYAQLYGFRKLVDLIRGKSEN